MNTLQIIADNPKSALEQVHRQLGPEAVVLSVRALPARGVGRLWHKQGPVEILAGLPGSATLSTPLLPAMGDAETTQSGQRHNMLARHAADNPTAQPVPSPRWVTVAWLEAMGLLSMNAGHLQNRLHSLHLSAPASLEAEWEIVREALTDFWPPATPPQDRGVAQTHAFIGPPGSGKTTVLCKWLTLATLTEERSARVLRLDGATANTAEFLSVHCEMLGVSVERFSSPSARHQDLHFVDLPGVEMDDAAALAELRAQLTKLPTPEVHLVLNSAYQTEVLLAQWAAFAALEPRDLILTHLDEETRRVKLWNLVFGTNCTIRFLSAGQKIPGEFRAAVPDLLFPSEIDR